MQPAHQLAPKPTADLYLGPATVREVAGLRPRVELPDGRETVAELALAFPFQPAEGDVLLLIERGGQAYVIGVLASAGTTALRFTGDVRVHAVGGKLELCGDRGLAIRAPEVAVTTGKMRVAADALVERVGQLVQSVRELFDLRAGSKCERISGESVLQAERASIQSRDVVTINGREVHLN